MSAIESYMNYIKETYFPVQLKGKLIRHWRLLKHHVSEPLIIQMPSEHTLPFLLYIFRQNTLPLSHPIPP